MTNLESRTTNSEPRTPYDKQLATALWPLLIGRWSSVVRHWTLVVGRPFALSAFCTGLVLIFLAACDFQGSTKPAAIAGPTAAGTEGAAPATPTPAVPQGGTLTIRLSEPIPDLKPWDLRSRGEEHVADLLYNGLVRL
ncbi:MAG: hypothetical protein M3380_14755, partial [Chloroflexota bacterium]|nr:hypothetical protein [Chloroflexota bacterium]